jgi:hypothetical protein
MFTGMWLWIPGSPPSKSAIADLDTKQPISGKPEIGAPRNDHVC